MSELACSGSCILRQLDVSDPLKVRLPSAQSANAAARIVPPRYRKNTMRNLTTQVIRQGRIKTTRAKAEASKRSSTGFLLFKYSGFWATLSGRMQVHSAGPSNHKENADTSLQEAALQACVVGSQD